MKWLSALFSSGAERIIKAVDHTLDSLTTTDEERLKAEVAKQTLKVEVMKTTQVMELKAQELIQKDLERLTRQAIAEISSKDSFVRRARPSVIYMGEVVIIMNYVIFPLIYRIIGSVYTPIQLPDMFWLVWGGWTGGYAFLRTLEKKGITLSTASSNTSK